MTHRPQRSRTADATQHHVAPDLIIARDVRASVMLSARICLRAACLLTALLSATLDPVTASAELKPVTAVEGIAEFQLDNGMSVLLFPDESKPTVTVNVTVFVGSRHEGYGEAGMAHLLEHMLFKGTPTHTDIPQALKDRGAEFNGTTWLDRTNYYETLPASDENLDFALKLEADRMVNSKVAAEDLAKEFSVVRSEFERGENSPVRVLWQRMVSASYLWHNYGNSTIGNRADIERVPVDNLRDFYRRYYQPDNAMLVIAGKFNPEQALELTEKYFGALPRPDRKLDATYTEEPAQDGERFVTLRRVGDVAAVGAVYHIPAGPHPDYVAVDVLESMLTAQPAGRLYKGLVETQKASFVFGSAFALHDPGILLIISQVNTGNDPQLVLDSLIDITEGVGKSEIIEDEVERAKQKLLKQWELTSADSKEIAIQLSEWAAQGDWRLYFLYRDRLQKVTADDVQDVAAKYLTRNNRTAGMYVPAEAAERISIPNTPSLAEMIGDYKGRETIAQGEVFDVSPTNVEARTTRTTLNGGLSVSLLPKKTRGENVVVKLTLRYGNEASLMNRSTACEFLPDLMVRGTQKLDRQQLQDALDKNFAELSASGGAGTASFGIETRRANLPAVLDLLRQVLREPTLPESEFDVLRSQTVTSLEEQKTEPTALAQNRAVRAVTPYPVGHPNYVATIEEEINVVKSVTLKDIQAVYSDFLGAGFGELSIVGDFDPETTMPQIQSILGGWSADPGYERVPRRGDIDVKASDDNINTPDKANAMYFAVTVFPLRDDAAEYPALLIGNDILGGGALANRLGNRVRQQDGLSYGIRSNVSVSSQDQRTLFYIYAIANPGNIPKVKTAIREEIDRIRKDGVTAEELEAARTGWIQRQAVSRAEDSSLASLLNSTAETQRSMQYYGDLEARVQKLTVEEVNAAIVKYIDPERLIIVAAGDFEGVDKKPAEADGK